MKKFLFLTLSLLMLGANVGAQSLFESQLPANAKKGATVYGVVEVDGKPLAGVAVSDGFEVTVTDKKGCYTLASKKKNGYVFITTPSGYEAPVSDVLPETWANLTLPESEAERHDFRLSPAEQSHHAIIAMTDVHLANQIDDNLQFTTLLMPRIREEVEKFRSKGIPVYTICMGDGSFDQFWYDYFYEIKDFRKTLVDVDYPTPFFNVMGNHDHDPSTPEGPDCDFKAGEKFRKAFGPNYYSFNIGKVHYVVLDNQTYLNEKTADQKPGRNVYGSRNRRSEVPQEQLDWLAKDLALVKDKTAPVVVAMHAPAFRYKNQSHGKISSSAMSDEESHRLAEAFKDFKDVHYLSGHVHRNFTTYGSDDPEQPLYHNAIDHNIAAACGAWWYTYSHGGLSLCKEGTPAGFEVFDIDGCDMKWYYTSVDEPSSKQFRCFDMNAVKEYFTKNAECRIFYDHFPSRYDFRTVKDNKVWIHLWAGDPKWKIRVTENGKECNVKEINAENPQAILSYYMPRTIWDRQFPSRYNKRARCAHMYQVSTSAPDTTLEIEVTDAFGNVYRETMVRPKAFSKTMR